MDELLELRKRVAQLEALEAERRRAMEALEESELRFRSVFENVASGILYDRFSRPDIDGQCSGAFVSGA